MADSEEPTTENEQSNKDDLTARQTYNLVSDTVTGANIRLKDNLIQAMVIFVCLVVGAIIGAVAIEVILDRAVEKGDRVAGACAGGFIGVLAGLFGHGIFLMVYRFVMHIRGRHD